MRAPEPGALRVAFVAGSLGQGGAEKQLYYAVRALRNLGVDVSVFATTRGERYEGALSELGVPPVWFGRHASPPLRVASLVAHLRRRRPHFVQASHFFVNLYAVAAASVLRGIAIGSLRSDVFYELRSNPFWGPRLLRTPRSLIANSAAARRNAAPAGVDERRVFVVPNVLDLSEFDRASAGGTGERGRAGECRILFVGSLIAAKRVDRLLESIARARRDAPGLRGLIAGDGPERASLEAKARALGLGPAEVEFLGRRDDVPRLLAGADALALTSEHEGFPNVLIEAMAAGLPVVTTPAGDAPIVVRDGTTGYVVGFDDAAALSDRIARLAGSEPLRRDLGQAGRRVVEREYEAAGLGDRLLDCYRRIAQQQGRPLFEGVAA